VEGQLAPGYAMGNVNNTLKTKIAEIIRTKPEGVNVVFGGEAEEMRETFTNMISALLLAVALVYMLMCALFESMLYPFVIMFALPQALIGALWALFLSGKSLSMVSMIGMIMLVGLVTKNAILLVDYTNTLRKRGKKRDEALIEAGPVRLRPILMTTLTVILGNLPIAMGLGKGSEFRSPMSVAVIGGLLVSTVLTLVIIPCTYSIVDDITKKLFRKKDDTFTASSAMGTAGEIDGVGNN
jgi:hydrophobic/amphiphilic exporter-1 (mainly G- bacteria), HAE1 family